MNLIRSKFWKGAIHILLLLCLIMVIGRHLWLDDGWGRFTVVWGQALKPSLFLALLLVLILCLINWLLEAKKWKILHPKLSLLQSLKTIWIGQTIGFITPFQLGDYIGRSYAMGWKNWKVSAYHTYLVSWAQNGVNVLVGLLLLVILENPWFNLISLNWWIFLVTITMVLTLLFLFGERLIKKWWREAVPLRTKVYLTSWSLVRYAVYFSQYCIVLYVLGIQMAPSSVMAGLATLFLVQSGIPLPPALVALARVELAILIFSYDGANELIVWSAALIVWVINVLIPVCIGYFWTIRHKGYATND